MNIYTRNCYTYLIGWSKLNIWYYGKQTRIGCDPSQLWVKYFTSSVHVERFRKKHGEPDIVQVRKIFGSDFQKCSKWETDVLTRFDCKADPRFLNRTNNTEAFTKGTSGIAPAYDVDQIYLGLIDCNDDRWGNTIFGINKFNTELSKDVSARNNKLVEQGIHPLQGNNNPSKKSVAAGTHHWLKSNNSEARRIADDYQRALVSAGEHHWQTEEHRIKTGKRTNSAIIEGTHPFSEKLICPHCGKTGQKAEMVHYHFSNCLLGPTPRKVSFDRVTCPHCNKVGGKNAMRRYHFSNCKHRATVSS